MFSTTRGVKQGCNLSPLLFSLYTNSLTERIHPVGETIFPSSCVMFANDVVVFSDDPHTLQKYINFSGHILQTTKSPNKPSQNKDLGIWQTPKKGNPNMESRQQHGRYCRFLQISRHLAVLVTLRFVYTKYTVVQFHPYCNCNNVSLL